MSNLQKKLFHKKGLAFGGLELVREDSSRFTPLNEDNTASDDKSSQAGVSGFYPAEYQNLKDAAFPVVNEYARDDSLKIRTYFSPPNDSGDNANTILFCNHGAGSSAMTFASLALYLNNAHKESAPGVFAYDMRGHGLSTEPEVTDFSLEELVADFEFVLKQFCDNTKQNYQFVLVGHSLGGSIMIDFLCQKISQSYNIRGLVIIDIVEETAVRALSSMSQFLWTRPKSFRSYEEAVSWHLQSRFLKNESSAKLSVYDLLQENQSGKLVWRADLPSMAPFWDTWFTGLSENFVQCGSTHENKIAKLLILSDNETLDRGLIVGQMQGKYQLVVFNNSMEVGHFVQEDIPEKLGITLMDYLRRNNPEKLSKRGSAIKPIWGGKIHE